MALRDRKDSGAFEKRAPAGQRFCQGSLCQMVPGGGEVILRQ